MQLGQTANLKLKQEQRLSQQQMQGLELLHCPVLELEQYLAAQLAANPVLEELAPLPSPDDDERESEDYSDDVERDEWGDEVNIPDPERLRRDAEQPDFWLNRPAPEPTLLEQLDAEIATSKCDAPHRGSRYGNSSFHRRLRVSQNSACRYCHELRCRYG